MSEKDASEGPFVDQLHNGPGVSTIDPSDPAAPYFQLLSRLCSPLTLRDLMIQSVRTGYIGQGQPVDPRSLPPSAEELYPQVRVSPLIVSRDMDPIVVDDHAFAAIRGFFAKAVPAGAGRQAAAS